MSGWLRYFSKDRSRYTAVPTNEVPSLDSRADSTGQNPADQPQDDRHARTRRALRVTAVGLMLVMAGSLVVAYA